MVMVKYHYQCAGCYCTLYADDLSEGDYYEFVVNGELCSSCHRDEDQRQLDDDQRQLDDDD